MIHYGYSMQINNSMACKLYIYIYIANNNEVNKEQRMLVV